MKGQKGGTECMALLSFMEGMGGYEYVCVFMLLKKYGRDKPEIKVVTNREETGSEGTEMTGKVYLYVPGLYGFKQNRVSVLYNYETIRSKRKKTPKHSLKIENKWTWVYCSCYNHTENF